MSTKRKAIYTEGGISKILFTHSIPMLFGIGAAISFSLIDTIFIAKVSTAALAAVTFTFPLVFTISGVAMGLGSGASAVISKAIGEGDDKKVKYLTTDAIILSLLLVSVFIILGMLFFDTAFTLMGAKPELLPLIKEYMMIWLPASIFFVLPLVGNAATRAAGDTKTPSMIMLFAVLANLALDPLFIFGLGPIPALGLKGAAIAGAISRILTFSFSFYIIGFRDKMLALEVPTWNRLISSWKEILYVGLPSVATNLIVPVGFGVVTSFVAKYGQDAVAAMGAASRVEMLVLVVFMALGSVLGPFVGQNYGAKNISRVRESIKKSYLFSVIWGIGIALIFAVFSHPLASIIKDDKALIPIIALYLQIIGISIAFRGITIIGTVTLNVLKKPIIASIITLCQVFIFFIPLAYLGSNIYGLEGIFVAGVIGSILSSFISYQVLKRVLDREEKDLVIVG